MCVYIYIYIEIHIFTKHYASASSMISYWDCAPVGSVREAADTR